MIITISFRNMQFLFQLLGICFAKQDSTFSAKNGKYYWLGESFKELFNFIVVFKKDESCPNDFNLSYGDFPNG